MNWASIVIAAAAGGLAALIAGMFAKPGEDKGKYAGIFVVLLALFYAGGKWWVLPKWEISQVESQLEEVPAFAAIKEHDLDSYQNLLVDVKQAMKSGKSQAEIVTMVRTHVSQVVERRLASASNEAVVNYISATMAELDELYKIGDDTCHRFLFPQGKEVVDPSKYFSKEVQQRDLAGLAQVIKSSAKDPQPVPSEAEVLPHLQPIFEKLAGKWGDDVALLQNPTGNSVNKRKVCEMAAAMYADILLLPTDDSGRVLRFMMASSP